MYAKLSDVGDDAAVKLVAYEESAKKGEHAALVSALVPHPASLCVVFGPEGGISPAEISLIASTRVYASRSWPADLTYRNGAAIFA